MPVEIKWSGCPAASLLHLPLWEKLQIIVAFVIIMQDMPSEESRAVPVVAGSLPQTALLGGAAQCGCENISWSSLPEETQHLELWMILY